MQLGLGLYRHMLTRDNFRFAKQAGATHIVAHYCDYFKGANPNSREDQPTGAREGWGIAGDPDKLWSFEELNELRKAVEAEGLKLEALEDFDPAHWYDILLDGPKKREQMENVKTLIRNVGRAGIPVVGYNFSLAGVAGRVRGPFARGGAESVGMDGPEDTPIPNGMIWNMVVDPNAPNGIVPSATSEELWQRLEYFLEEILPVAEEAGVKMAAHPDDPPCETVRAQPRLVYQPHLYQKLLDLKPHPSNALEFCIGSLAEMTEGDIYETVETYSSQEKIAYIHFRNVRGKVPFYKETFIDDGDIDMIRVLKILKKNKYTGVLIPDHTPQMTCDAPWHAGMAYALGYMKAAVRIISE
jgi:mannonate dehydratase